MFLIQAKSGTTLTSASIIKEMSNYPYFFRLFISKFLSLRLSHSYALFFLLKCSLTELHIARTLQRTLNRYIRLLATGELTNACGE
jgi:hypothetical protein